MTRAECGRRFAEADRRWRRLAWWLLPLALVVTFLFVSWTLQVTADTRHRQAEIRRSFHEITLARASVDLRTEAFLSVMGALVGWLVVAGAMGAGMCWVAAQHAPRCGHCGRALPVQLREHVLASGQCPRCGSALFSVEAGLPDPPPPPSVLGQFLPFATYIHRLRPKYSLCISFLVLGGTFASFIPDFFFARWSAGIMHIPEKSPVIAEPNGVPWMLLFLTVMVAGILLGNLAAYAVLAGLLRYVRHWPAARIHALIFRSQIPPHWLRPAEPRQNEA